MKPQSSMIALRPAAHRGRPQSSQFLTPPFGQSYAGNLEFTLRVPKHSPFGWRLLTYDRNHTSTVPLSGACGR